ncbi:MAG: hypothetical protein SVU32_05290 [Candidatus Nanohaloarchaea archaeon]|nr:hypothetical protein [Candidatus Nanohaloarchaea archaeon]
MTTPSFDYDPLDTVADIEPVETWTYRDAHCNIYHLNEDRQPDSDALYLGTFVYKDEADDTAPTEQICFECGANVLEAEDEAERGPPWSDNDYDDPIVFVKDWVETEVDTYLKQLHGLDVPENHRPLPDEAWEGIIEVSRPSEDETEDR